MKARNIRIGLAALPISSSFDECLKKIEATLKYSARRKVDIICFPETYIPGIREPSSCLPPPNQKQQKYALTVVKGWAKCYSIAVIIGMEWVSKGGLLNLAYVINPTGRVLGYQAKNQITPRTEELFYVPDGRRRLFTVKGVKFGIVICHEGWRYPETVRWAATRGARIIFQPQCTGSDEGGKKLKKWGESFYEKAMICRAHENSVFFASVNNAMRYQTSATSLIAPNGICIEYVPYGKEWVLIQNLDIKQATGFYASRYNPRFYPD